MKTNPLTLLQTEAKRLHQLDKQIPARATLIHEAIQEAAAILEDAANLLTEHTQNGEKP